MREIYTNIPWAGKTITFFVALLLFSTFGLAQTSVHFNLWERLVFWSINITGIGFFMHVVKVAFLNFSYLRILPKLVIVTLAVGVAAVPATSFFIFVSKVCVLPNIHPDQFPEIWAQIVVVVLVIRAVEFGTKTEDFEPVPIAKDQLFDRLPKKLRSADIISLSMQDHYAEVTTTKGPHLVLIRFSDAVALLDTTEGAQIHRSHWVASAHAKSLKKCGRRHDLLLSDGRVLPVSASFLSAAETLLEPAT